MATSKPTCARVLMLPQPRLPQSRGGNRGSDGKRDPAQPKPKSEGTNQPKAATEPTQTTTQRNPGPSVALRPHVAAIEDDDDIVDAAVLGLPSQVEEPRGWKGHESILSRVNGDTEATFEFGHEVEEKKASGRVGGRDWEPYQLQGDERFDTPRSKARRAESQRHPEVGRAIERFWETMRDGALAGGSSDQTGGNGLPDSWITREQYEQVHTRMGKALRRDFDWKKAKALARYDFARDCRAGGGGGGGAATGEGMTFGQYREGLLELADLWTLGFGWRRYACFLTKLFIRITEKKEDGSVDWKDVDDIEPFEEQELEDEQDDLNGLGELKAPDLPTEQPKGADETPAGVTTMRPLPSSGRKRRKSRSRPQSRGSVQGRTPRIKPTRERTPAPTREVAQKVAASTAQARAINRAVKVLKYLMKKGEIEDAKRIMKNIASMGGGSAAGGSTRKPAARRRPRQKSRYASQSPARPMRNRGRVTPRPPLSARTPPTPLVRNSGLNRGARRRDRIGGAQARGNRRRNVLVRNGRPASARRHSAGPRGGGARSGGRGPVVRPGGPRGMETYILGGIILRRCKAHADRLICGKYLRVSQLDARGVFARMEAREGEPFVVPSHGRAGVGGRSSGAAVRYVVCYRGSRWVLASMRGAVPADALRDGRQIEASIGTELFYNSSHSKQPPLKGWRRCGGGRGARDGDNDDENPVFELDDDYKPRSDAPKPVMAVHFQAALGLDADVEETDGQNYGDVKIGGWGRHKKGVELVGGWNAPLTGRRGGQEDKAAAVLLNELMKGAADSNGDGEDVDIEYELAALGREKWTADFFVGTKLAGLPDLLLQKQKEKEAEAQRLLRQDTEDDLAKLMNLIQTL